MEYNALWTTLKGRLAGLRAPWPAIRRNTPIGFDLASERLNLAQITRTGGELRWQAVAGLPYPGPRDALLNDRAAFRGFVRDGFKRHGFRGRRGNCPPWRRPN